jgi:hypothetical protein
MSKYVVNPIQFAADCAQQSGQCTIVRENIFFLDDGKEESAIDLLQRKCGSVVIIPDTSNQGQALLYHTSCDRMTDLVNQLFQGRLEAPVSFPQAASEMMVGELHRQRISLSYDDCKAKVEGFNF